MDLQLLLLFRNVKILEAQRPVILQFDSNVQCGVEPAGSVLAREAVAWLYCAHVTFLCLCQPLAP